MVSLKSGATGLDAEKSRGSAREDPLRNEDIHHIRFTAKVVCWTSGFGSLDRALVL
jgi:hypothetical protein